MKRPTAAFTLVEMLVVVGIIAVLIAISVPALTGARNLSKSRAAGNYGATVSLTIGGFLSTRPGLSVATFLSTNPGFALPDAQTVYYPTNGVVKDCGKGYTLTGSASAPVVALGGSSSATGNTWPAAMNGTHCILSAKLMSNSPYSFSVITWDENTPGTYYVNGQKP